MMAHFVLSHRLAAPTVNCENINHWASGRVKTARVTRRARARRCCRAAPSGGSARGPVVAPSAARAAPVVAVRARNDDPHAHTIRFTTGAAEAHHDARRRERASDADANDRDARRARAGPGRTAAAPALGRARRPHTPRPRSRHLSVARRLRRREAADGIAVREVERGLGVGVRERVGAARRRAVALQVADVLLALRELARDGRALQPRRAPAPRPARAEAADRVQWRRVRERVLRDRLLSRDHARAVATAEGIVARTKTWSRNERPSRRVRNGIVVLDRQAYGAVAWLGSHRALLRRRRPAVDMIAVAAQLARRGEPARAATTRACSSSAVSASAPDGGWSAGARSLPAKYSLAAWPAPLLVEQSLRDALAAASSSSLRPAAAAPP